MDAHPDLTGDLSAHGAALRRTARALVADEHAADDAVQDAWLAALTRGDRSPLAAPLAWLRTVVRRRALDQREGSHARAARRDPLELDRLAADTSTEPSEAALRVARAVHGLPSADREVVVRRYWQGQPPRVIAEELGLEPRAVRNRLHRALGRLRRELAGEPLARVHDRRQLALLLAPLSPTRPAPLGFALPLLMTIKAAALLAVVSLAVLALLIRGPLDPVAPAEVAAPPAAQALESEGTVALATAEPHQAGGDRAVAEPRGGRDVARPSGGAEEGVAFGGLALVVVDGAADEATLEYILRARRIGPEGATTTDGASLPSTAWAPGRWEGAIFRAGFDPLFLDEFMVRAGEVTDLGRRRLEPGTGTLEGTVVGLEGGRCTVELHGVGRRPGRCCAERATDAETACEVCGHSERCSVRDVEAGASFAFEQLAGGPYDVVVKEPGGRVVASRRLVLDPREARWMRIAVEATDVELWLTGPDEQPFDGLWMEDGLWFSSTLRIATWAEEALVTTGDVAPAEEGRRVDRNDLDRSLLAVNSVFGAQGGDADEPLPSLWPSALDVPPRVAGVAGVVERLAPGRFVVRRVPAEVTSAQVACGPFITPRTRFELQPGVGRVARIRVLERCSLSSKDVPANDGISCTNCHRAPDVR